jgi:rhodanese-related sulfurtransferase/mannose-6-phosphate isomerase-like protein (cupin superfamily)
MPFAVEETVPRDNASTRTPEDLAKIVSHFAASEGWMERVRLNAERRWYERVSLGQDYDIWVISWLPGQSTGFHDHGESAGAFVVATGSLEEHRPGQQPVVVGPGESRVFGADYLHDVRNASTAPAISIHAYSPPLDEMNHYELDGTQLIPLERASDKAEAMDEAWRARTQQAAKRDSARSIDQVLAEARARLQRLSPLKAEEAIARNGAVLVDIRPQAQRAIEGTIPGALTIERNVLEWRFDPASNARLPIATGHDLHVIVFCSEGYTSSLAAAALQDLGLWRATDVSGGFQGWKAAGLPIEASGQLL